MNYFFAGSTFQFGIRRISTFVLTVPVKLYSYLFEKVEVQILEKLAWDQPPLGMLLINCKTTIRKLTLSFIILTEILK